MTTRVPNRSLPFNYGVWPICPKRLPPACVLKNLKPLLLTELKANHLKQLCIQIWPQYQLDSQDHWPEFGTFDFNILQNLTDFPKRNGKWSEVPCAQAFWALQSRPSLCKACSTHKVLLCSLSPKQKGCSSTNRLWCLPHPWSLTPLTSPLPTSHTSDPLLPLHPAHLLTPKPLLTLPSTPLPHLPDPDPFPPPPPLMNHQYIFGTHTRQIIE